VSSPAKRPKVVITVEVWMRVRDGAKLEALMKYRGVSQRELARAVGWQAHSCVSRLVDGTTKTLTTDKAHAIADYLGESNVDSLFINEISRKTVGSRQHNGKRAA
jgi:predicted XRE-type DNA-binding protein